MTRVRPPRSRLAGYSPNGKIWLNKYIPRDERARVRRHERTEYNLRKHGMGQHHAHMKALMAEHRGMTIHQIEVYEGRLGAVARWHPKHHHRRR